MQQRVLEILNTLQVQGNEPEKTSGDTTGAWDCAGKTVPTGAGYRTGCVFKHLDGSGGNDVLYVNIGDETTANFVPLTPGLAQIGFGKVPLAELREIVGSDIYSLTDTPATSNGAGSLLAKNTTPILERINGDTDGALRVNWAGADVDPVLFQAALHPKINVAADFVLHFRAAMAAVADTPTIACQSFFNEGDTAVADASAAVTGVSYAEYSITIAAADIPAGAQTISCKLTPAAHGTDALYITAIWYEYTLVAT